MESSIQRFQYSTLDAPPLAPKRGMGGVNHSHPHLNLRGGEKVCWEIVAMLKSPIPPLAPKRGWELIPSNLPLS